MKIINKETGEKIASIITNHSMTLDEAIALVGEYHAEKAEDNEPEVEIKGKLYYYDDLEMDYND